MAARRDRGHVSVSAEEWEALNARLRDAEEKVRTVQRGATEREPEEHPREEFLAMLAHELRNLLAPIRNAVEIMRLIGQKDAAIDRARELIARQVDHLSRLVDDLLDVSHITQGKITLDKSPVDLNAVIAGAVEMIRLLVDQRKHRLTVQPLPQPVIVEGDHNRLMQVVGNLLSNAAQHTAPGGEITLSAKLDEDAVLVSVADSGAGIAPDLLPHVFDFFMQAQRTDEREQGGLGLGLSLVRDLVRLHGGTVEARSAGLEQGSEFIVRLPLPKPRARANAPVSRDPGREMPRRIVVIDDNRDAAESLAMLLRLKGHGVEIAFDGPSGLALALKSAPDCVLVDIGLPGMDGYEVAKRLRSHDHGGRTLLIALTGYGQEEDRTRSRHAGFDHHLVKPVAQNVLEDLLRDR